MSFNSRYNSLKKEYIRLMRKYAVLNREYKLALHGLEYLHMKLERSFLLVSMSAAFLVTLVCFMILRSTLMIEFGTIAFATDIIWELYGTGKGWWKYRRSTLYDICDRVPVEIPLGVAFLASIMVALSIYMMGMF